MLRFFVVLILIACAASVPGQVTKTCPWVTSGTAERLLGGEASVVAHIDANAFGSCRFTRQGGSSTASIEILVGLADTHPCSSDSTKLKAIGNEAVQCRHNSTPSEQSDQIAGRIRKMYFVVTMTNLPDATKQEPSDPHLADAYGASPIQRLAELVVGNLY